jgi:hypothetical protein
MASELKSSPSRLEGPIQSLLAGLRRRIRAYIWADAAAAVVVVLGASFWASLALDWLFEPPRTMRIVVLAAVVLALVWVVYRFLIERMFVRLADRNMALLVERRFRTFQDSLLTAVELSEQPEHAQEFNSEMLAHTHRDALDRAAQVDLAAMFNTAPLVRRISLAVALMLGVAVLALGATDVLAVWARRSLLLSDELWPRKTRLSIDGFAVGQHMKIARGSDFQLAVKADAALDRAIPEIVEVRYATIDGGRGRQNMSREGVAVPGRAPFQEYSHTFKSVLTSLSFHVVGGDDRRGPYYLDVVDSPTISRMTLHCEYPAYMRRAARDIPVAGLMQVPRGTQITLEAQANKSLVSVQIDEVADERAPQTHQLDLAAERDAPQTSFRFSLPPLDADKTLLFTLRDTDEIRSREAVRLALAVVADEPPQVNVQLQGIGTAITPQAQLPAAGEVSDDYGVAKVWFEFHADEAPSTRQSLAEAAEPAEKVAVSGALEVRDLELQPKQKLHVTVQAADTLALDGGPNVGSSQKYALDVVTPEQLRAMLEARELALRRRFETIIEELTNTRDLLAGISLGAKEATDQEADAEEKKSTDPLDKDTAPARIVSPSVLIERVLQNSQRSAHETLQVATAFDEMRTEMINNRVDTEELNTRLKDGVADPLRRIVGQMFPPLDEQLKKLAAQLSNVEQAGPLKSAAVERADAILVEMRAVLDKMLELETFNEVLETLRQIISSQEKINDQTKDQQKKALKKLEGSQ